MRENLSERGLLGQADRQTDRQASRQASRQTDRQTDRQASRQASRQTDRQTDRQAGRQASRQAGRQTDRQTEGRTDRETDRLRQRQRQTDIAAIDWPQSDSGLYPSCTEPLPCSEIQLRSFWEISSILQHAPDPPVSIIETGYVDKCHWSPFICLLPEEEVYPEHGPMSVRSY